MKRVITPPATRVAVVAVGLVCAVATGQTMLDLKSQARNIDFSRSPSTKPFAVGVAMPPICSVGQAYFKEDAQAGQNLFLCTGVNTWSAVSEATSTQTDPIPVEPENAGKLLGTDGIAPGWRSLVGFTDDGSRFIPDDTVLGKLAGNNVWTGHQRFPASPAQMLTAASNAIACNRHTVAISATAALTMTSAPTVLNGSDGQICVITNVGAGSVTLQREDTLASSNLQLSTDRVTIPPKGRVTLQYNAAIGDWIQETIPNTGGQSSGSGLQPPSATGMVAQTALSGVTAARTLTGTNGIAVMNGDGVLGDPTFSLPGSSKGDLIVHNGTGNTQLVSGTDGQTLVADSANAKGLKWTSRTVAGANGVSVANGDWSTGTAANITIPGTVKGDLIVHDGSTNIRVPAGTNGQALIADSTDTKGLKWASRTVAGANGVSVANGDWSTGTAANVTIPGTAKGDIIVHNGSTNVRTAVGTNGQTLIADSTDAKGLKWTSRTVAGANGVSVANGDWSTGAAANVTIPGTAKGDIIVHNGSTNVRTAVGTNGQTLVADSTDAKGLKWTSRTVAGANGVSVANGDWSTGAAANITIPGTVKGDLIVHDGSTNIRVPVGTNGQALVADSTDAKGLKWTSRTVAGANGVSVANGDWSTGDAANVTIPGTAKGDLIVHDGSTNIRVPVGTNGQALVSDSTDPKGLKWTSRTIAGTNGVNVTNGDWSTGAAASITMPGTSKGDIIVHNGSTNARVPVGTNGQALVADSTRETGVKYATISIVPKCYAPGNSTMSNGSTSLLGTAPLTGLAPGGLIRYSARFTTENGTTSTRRARVSFGGVDVSDEVGWSQATFLQVSLQGEIALTGSSTQYNTSLLLGANANPGSVAVSTGGRAGLTSADISAGTATLNIYGGVTNPAGTEQLTLRHMCVEYIPPAVN